MLAVLLTAALSLMLVGRGMLRSPVYLPSRERAEWLVGGVAVIASLIYVGMQVKQGNRQARDEAAREVATQSDRYLESITSDEKAREIFMVATGSATEAPLKNPAGLGGDDLTIMSLILYRAFHQIDSHYRAWTAGALDRDQWEKILPFLHFHLGTEASRDWWNWVRDIRDYNALLGKFTDPHFVELFREASTNFNDLSRNDQARMHGWLLPHILLGYGNSFIDRNGVEPLSVLADQSNSITINAPGFAQWWEVFGHAIPAEYKERIDQAEGQIQAGEFHQLMPWFLPDEQGRGE